MKKKKIIIFAIIVFIIIFAICTIFIINAVVLGHVKSEAIKTGDEFLVAHAKLLAKQNTDTTQEHARDTSQKVQIVNQKVYFLKENNLYCYSGKSFENKTLIESNITRFLVCDERLYYVKELSQSDGGILFECKIDGMTPKKIMDNITDFTVEKRSILYVQSYSDGDKHKIIEYFKDTGEKKILTELLNYSDLGGRKVIFFDNYIIIPEYEIIGVYNRKSGIKTKFYEGSFDSVSPFVFQENCYISLIRYNDDYDFPIPPVNRELTGIWKFDFEQDKLVQVSRKHARFSEIVEDELTLYDEFSFSSSLVKKYILFSQGEREPKLVQSYRDMMTRESDTTDEKIANMEMIYQAVEGKLYYQVGTHLMCYNKRFKFKKRINTNTEQFLVYKDRLYTLESDMNLSYQLFVSDLNGDGKKKIADCVDAFTIYQNRLMLFRNRDKGYAWNLMQVDCFGGKESFVADVKLRQMQSFPHLINDCLEFSDNGRIYEIYNLKTGAYEKIPK